MSISYAQACLDPNLFGDWFGGPTWATWRVLDKALFGEPLTDDELAVFQELTGRDQAPTVPASEAWWIMGRRSGKDVKAASLVAYLGTIGAETYGWKKHLVRGERGVVSLLAVDREQAGICLGYARAFFEKPLLARMVKRMTADSIDLTNGLSIEIATNDQRRVRGRTIVAAVFDECAHWRSEDLVNPDEDVYQALRPAMVTIPNAMLIGITSPHARKGLVWRKYQEHYGKPGDVLVARAPTWRMNLTLRQDSKLIADAYEGDPQWAAAEFGAEFRSDLEALFNLETIEACIEPGTVERPPMQGFRYVGFIDPSGGSSDSMTMSIAHKEGPVGVQDVLREIKPPFDPASVVAEFVKTLQDYDIRHVHGDRYAGSWVSAAFGKAGMPYFPSPRSKSELYLDLLPQINSRTALLLDNKRQKNQLVSLERRAGRGTGKYSVDHPNGSHDDLANVGAGVLCALGFTDEYRKSDIKTEVPEGKYAVQARAVFPQAHARTGSRMRS